MRGKIYRIEPGEPPVPLPDRGPDRSDDVSLSHDALRRTQDRLAAAPV